MKRPLLILAAFLSAKSAAAAPEHGKGFEAALRGCETWILYPSDGPAGTQRFVEAIGLVEGVAPLAAVPPSALPPPELRVGMRHWKIPVSREAGFILTVSTDLPMCHLVGQGRGDFAGAVEAAVSSEAFAGHWERMEDLTEGADVSSILYRSRIEPKLSLVVSRRLGVPDAAREVKVIATATYDPGG